MPDWLVVVLLVEATSLVIALLMPITPSRTGSKWSPASMFFEAPTYLEDAMAWFLISNAIIGLLGLMGWFVVTHDRSN